MYLSVKELELLMECIPYISDEKIREDVKKMIDELENQRKKNNNKTKVIIARKREFDKNYARKKLCK